MYYGIGGLEQMTLYDISKKINVSKERVRQIKEQAINKMKNSEQYQTLKEYVGVWTAKISREESGFLQPESNTGEWNQKF